MNNMLDLNNVSLGDIRDALIKRGKQNQFLSDEERDKVIDILLEYDCGWFYDDISEAIEMHRSTNFGYDALNDKELYLSCKQFLDDHDIDFDEDSDSNEIFIANLVARLELETALELATEVVNGENND